MNICQDVPCSTSMIIRNFFEKPGDLWNSERNLKIKKNIEIYLDNIESKFIFPFLNLQDEQRDSFIEDNLSEFQNIRVCMILELIKFLDQDEFLSLIEEGLQSIKIDCDDSAKKELQESISIYTYSMNHLLKIEPDASNIQKYSQFINEVLLTKSSLIDLFFSSIFIGEKYSVTGIVKRLRKEIERYYTCIRKFSIEVETGLPVSTMMGRLVVTENHLARMKNYLPKEEIRW